MNIKQELLKALLATIGENKACDSLAEIDKAFDILLKAEYKRGFIDGSETTGIQAKEIEDCKWKDLIEEIKLAKDCLNFKGCYCSNKDCKNKYCPLHKNN